MINHQENKGLAGEKPWVTFCMTTYKRPGYLKKQLNAILKQSFSNFNIIISDNDNAASGEGVVVEINDARIFYECNNENLGMIKSFNKSLAKAKTDYVIMITDDDPVYPDMLEVLYGLFLQNPGFGIYFGGYDRVYSVAKTAKTGKAKTGTNSQLADLDLGTVRTFSAIDFASAYLNNEFGGGIFWSVGIVKREIALRIGGIPDYGTPNMSDCGYIFLSGIQEGGVFINTSLGYQLIHTDNYSYLNANFKDFSSGAYGFYDWVKLRLPQTMRTPYLDKKIKDFIARMLVSFFIDAKKEILNTKKRNDSFEKCIHDSFKIDFMQKWKLKYLLGVYYPSLFPLLISIKMKLMKKK